MMDFIVFSISILFIFVFCVLCVLQELLLSSKENIAKKREKKKKFFINHTVCRISYHRRFPVHPKTIKIIQCFSKKEKLQSCI